MGNAGIYWACLKLHLHFLSLFHDYVSSVIASASVSLRFSNKRREAFFLSNEHLLTLKENNTSLFFARHLRESFGEKTLIKQGPRGLF